MPTPEKRIAQEREELEGIVEQANEPEPPQVAPTDPKRPSLKD